MLQWNELRVTPDGKYLIIDVQVQNMDYYQDVTLAALYLNIYKKPEDFTAPMPDSKSILLWQYEPSKEKTEDTTTEEGELNSKHIRKFIDIDGLSENLFFVYAVADGEATPETPCGCADHVLIGITYNQGLLYKNSVNALSTINDCTPSLELIDYILNEKAFEISLKTGDYRGAIGYWNNVFKSKITATKPCKCHGY